MIQRFTQFFFGSSATQQRILLIILGILFYIPFIGNVHLFDWDEINFAEISREMMISGEYFRSQIDFHSFYEKPPLFNWLQIISFKAFGINEFAARLPNAIFGIFSLLLIFEVGKRKRNRKFGMLWAILFLGSLLPFFFFKSGIIDPVFNFFIFYSIYLLSVGYNKKSLLYFFLAGLVSGLAIITKGPVGLLLAGVTLFCYEILYVRRLSWFKIRQYLLFGVGALIITLIWLLPQYIIEGNTFIINFTNYMIELLTQDVAMQGQPFYYHFIVIFVWCFPIAIIALRNLFHLHLNNHSDFNKWMFCLFWVVLIIFSIVTTKIVHYSSMTYIPLAYLAADICYRLKDYPRLFFKKLFLIIGIIHGLVFLIFAILINFYKPWLIEISDNIFGKEVVRLLEIPLESVLYSLFFIFIVCITYRYFKRHKVYRAVMFYTVGFCLFFTIELAAILPGIEKAVQGPAIEFYQRYAGKNVYMTTIGFKSYARIYYFDKTPEQAKYSKGQLLAGQFDKPVYYVIQNHNLYMIKDRPDLELVEQKGGFLLYVKKPIDAKE